MNNSKLSISKGNSKLGNIPSLSKTPVATCPKGVPCSSKCYAMKSYRMYPSVRTAWDKNTRLIKEDILEVERQMKEYLDKHTPAYFRVNVAGDIEDLIELALWYELALSYQDTRFLIYTKNYALLERHTNLFMSLSDILPDFSIRPNNLVIYVSQWLGEDRRKEASKGLCNIAGTFRSESDVPEGYYICRGDCRECKACYNDVGNIAFILH